MKYWGYFGGGGWTVRGQAVTVQGFSFTVRGV